MREDYSRNGTAWEYFPHDHARSRVYRWNEDGLAGICDRNQYLCFALALWNGRDPILKERLFGLTGSEGNHGEDVKEYYFYIDSTPTHSYMSMLYKYPQGEFPYAALTEENRRRGLNTGLFGGNSNWRGPVWFPINYLLIEALQRFHHYYGDDLRVECPTGSGHMATRDEVARELSWRLIRLLLRDGGGGRPIYGGREKLQMDPYWRDWILFNEYFHGDHGAGLGASHQTGWTGLIAKLIQ